MHVGSNGTYMDSKNEAVCFTPPGLDLSMFNMSPVPVLDGYITYTDKFKYLGSYVTSDLSDMYDAKNRVVQANKTMASITPHGCKGWALKESDCRILQIFHTLSICCILNINIMEPVDNYVGLARLHSRRTQNSCGTLLVHGTFNPCPTGCPQQIIWHKYLCALHMMGAIPADDKEGKLAGWFSQATEYPKEWERHQRLLTSNLIGHKEWIEG
eukprot:5572334-Ditylum_brightwellii.AAC.1